MWLETSFGTCKRARASDWSNGGWSAEFDLAFDNQHAFFILSPARPRPTTIRPDDLAGNTRRDSVICINFSESFNCGLPRNSKTVTRSRPRTARDRQILHHVYLEPAHLLQVFLRTYPLILIFTRLRMSCMTPSIHLRVLVGLMYAHARRRHQGPELG